MAGAFALGRRHIGTSAHRHIGTGAESLFPYIAEPALDLGFYRLEAFPVLVCVAVVIQFQIVMRRAPRFGIDRETTSTLLGWAIGLGLVGAHVFDLLVYYPERLLANPLLLFAIWAGLSSFGGMIGGLSGLVVVMIRRAMPAAQRLRFIDCLMFALPFTLAAGRLGCALHHDHRGIATTHWLGVAFPEGPRFDLGLLESLYCAAMAAVFLLLDRRRRPDGFYLGLFFALYGPVRFWMDALRIDDARYLGWTPAQYLSILAAIGGLATVLFVLRREPPRPREPGQRRQPARA